MIKELPMLILVTSSGVIIGSGIGLLGLMIAPVAVMLGYLSAWLFARWDIHE